MLKITSQATRVAKPILFLSFLLFLTIYNPLQANAIITTKVKYYSAELDIQYDAAMLKKNKHCTDSKCIKNFYEKIEATDYKLLLKDLLDYREKFKLNDWFFFDMVQKTIEDIYPEKSSMYKTTVSWFFMTKAGYDTRLYTAQNKFTFLYIRTNDEVYEMPIIRAEGQTYLNLTSIYYGAKTKGLLMEVQKFQPGIANKDAFSLKIENYPELPPMVVKKEFRFVYNQKPISLKIKIDTSGNQLLKNYPFVKVMNYIKTPFTNTTRASLIEAFQPYLSKMEIEDQLSFLVAFTRKGFEFEEDQVKTGKDMPLTAEATLIASTSDYEDRVSIFYQLLKETTDLNFVVIQYLYDDIITVGVELPEVIGAPFMHDGVSYTICDPTMPANTTKLGIYPISLDRDIDILEEVVQKSEVGMKD